MEKQKETYCQKLAIRGREFGSPSILLGVIIEDKENYIIFQTKKKKHYINRNEILQITTTNIIFEKEQETNDD